MSYAGQRVLSVCTGSGNGSGGSEWERLVVS
jgi:hypothetical protein